MKYKHVSYIEQDCCTGCIAFGEKDICWALNDTCNGGIYVEDKEDAPDYPALLARCKVGFMSVKDDWAHAYLEPEISILIDALLADLEKAGV